MKERHNRDSARQNRQTRLRIHWGAVCAQVAVAATFIGLTVLAWNAI